MSPNIARFHADSVLRYMIRGLARVFWTWGPEKKKHALIYPLIQPYFPHLFATYFAFQVSNHMTSFNSSHSTQST